MVRRADIAILPSEALLMPADCYVVVDSLRATTTLATLFARGVRDVLVVDDIEAARRQSKEEGRLLLGEVDGLPPEGFDLGNSPTAVLEADVAGRGATLFTTNGTRALCQLAGQGTVLTGALANATAVSEALDAFEDVVIVCAGNEGGQRFALEDFATAAVIVRLVARRHPAMTTGDAAGVGVDLQGYENWIAPSLPQRTAPSRRWMAASAHARRIAALGFGADIHFAAQEDTSSAVPSVIDYGKGWALLAASDKT